MATEAVADEFRKPGLRLARHGMRPRTGRMERFLKKLGITHRQYNVWSGDQALNAFARANPDWTQRAWEVLMLENVDTIKAWPQTSSKKALSLSTTEINTRPAPEPVVSPAVWSFQAVARHTVALTGHRRMET